MTKLYDCIPSAGTFSRDAKAWGFPRGTYAVEGNGAYVKLNDGQWYLDWVCGLGPNLLGYGHTGFDSRVAMHLRRGVAFSLQSYLEVEAGSKLVCMLGKHVPGWTPEGLGVRWGLSGGDACSTAIRLARAVRGQNHVLSVGYHGANAEFVCTTPPALGIIPEESVYMHSVEFNDVDSITRVIDNLVFPPAAIIIENPSIDPNPEYYSLLRKICNETGALLIIDEIVTGLRYGLGGACERYDIEPDLVCMGKALGNGVPVSVLVGRKEYMDWFAKDSPPFCSSTFWGNGLSMSAVSAMLDIWNQKYVDQIWDMGKYFMEQMASTGIDIIGHSVRSLFQFKSDAARAWFIQTLRKHNILANRPNFVNICHTKQDVDKTRDAIMEVWNTIPSDKKELEFKMRDCMPKVLFKNR